MKRRLALLPLVGLALLGADSRELRREDGTRNPHGDPHACSDCHLAGPSPDQPGPYKPIIQTCRSCHPTADMHMVGEAPSTVRIAEGFPLHDGLVTCTTCHVEPAHGGDEVVPAPYHRGGPYADVLDLCFQCHDRSTYARHDPHHPVGPREQDDESCAACHKGPPETRVEAAKARLREDPEAACRTCHEGWVHVGASTHVGKQVPAEVAAKLPAELALMDGRIACWTCHEVHATHQEDRVADRWRGERPLSLALRQGAVQSEWDLPDVELDWPGTVDEEHPPLLALPVEDGALCHACHGDGP
ncbi:hypothetical protein L6R53_00420 [Myxococcota bacterium]|nr:hypothetical protein [Myxococcota bacterium]